jgi:hypothetical protein
MGDFELDLFLNLNGHLRRARPVRDCRGWRTNPARVPGSAACALLGGQCARSEATIATGFIISFSGSDETEFSKKLKFS